MNATVAGPSPIQRRLTSAFLLLAGWTVPGLVSAGQTYFLLVREGNPLSFARSLAIQLPLWWFWAIATPVIAWLLRRWPLERGRLAIALAVHLPAATVAAIGHSAFIAFVTRAMVPPRAGEAVQPYLVWFRGYLRYQFQFELLTYALVLLGLLAVTWYRRLRERDLAASRLQAQLSDAELRALKMQLHPHFLFNTLHAISVLIRENPDAAQRTVTLLGDLLRSTLATAGIQEVTLREELTFLRRYLEIEEIRFQDRLTVQFEIDPAAEAALVPNLILQPLVENAVRHAVEPRPGPGRVVVRARREGDTLELAVLDDGPGFEDVTTGHGSGIGLSTTRARLAGLYGKEGRLRLDPRPEGGLAVIVCLPFRESAMETSRREQLDAAHRRNAEAQRVAEDGP
jgi:two-component system LytT family sensor kinase